MRSSTWSFRATRCRTSTTRSSSRTCDLTLEVQQQLGDGVVRTIAMGASEGLQARHWRSRPPARRSRCRSARARSGASWTCSASRRTTAARCRPRTLADPPPGAALRRAGRRTGSAGHRHQGHRPAGAVRQGRQGRPVRRRRRRQDRQHARAHQQHRQAVLGTVGVRRRRRAHARGQRLLSRDDRVGRHRQGQPRRTPRSRWSTAR